MKASKAPSGMQAVLVKYFPEKAHTEVLPCPACGKEDLLWFGVESATTSGVGCRRCHLRVTENWDEYAPRPARKVPDKDYLDYLYIHYAFRALVTWNKILRSAPCPTKPPKRSKASPSPTTGPSATPTSASTPPATPRSSSSSGRAASRGRKPR